MAKKSAIFEDGSKAISTKEARKILGNEFSKLSDKQVDDLVMKLHLIAIGSIIPKSSI